MSIIYCYGCDRRVDTDYEEVHNIKDLKLTELICNNCKEEEEDKLWI